MGLTLYLLPEEASIDPQVYGDRVKTVLLEMRVITDEKVWNEPNWYATIPTEDTGDWPCAAYCVITASENVDLVPQEGAYPRCPVCRFNLDNDFVELINGIDDDWGGPERSRAYLEARMTCPACRRVHTLTELAGCGRDLALTRAADGTGIYLSGTFVRFVDVGNEPSPAWLADFDARTGWKHRALEYGWT